MSSVRFQVNGQACKAPLEGRLIDWLREGRGFVGVKPGCDVGRCGACMVLINGEAVNACLVPLWRLEGAAVVTPEGLEDDPVALVVRQSLADENAFQCGYCAPGLVVSLVAALRADATANEASLRSALVGHVCRCTGYHSILRGALRAAARLSKNGAARFETF